MASQAKNDLTLSVGTTGQAVTSAVVERVKELFGDDYDFFYRMAWVETKFGEEQSRFNVNLDTEILLS